MTTEAALTKLSYVLGKTVNRDASVKRAMLLQNLRGEITVESEDADSAHLLDRAHVSKHENNLVKYLADLFVKADKTGDRTDKGFLWAQRLAPALACAAAATNNVTVLQELNEVLGHPVQVRVATV